MSQNPYTIAFIQPNLYKDSVALMRVAQRLLSMPEIVNATLQMGNPANKDILSEAGLLTDAVKDAGPSDIMVVVQAHNQQACETAVQQCHAQLSGQNQIAGSAGADGLETQLAAKTIAMGLQRWSSEAVAANLVQISVPGAYAAAEALKAVKQGLNVFLFSDNVPLEQEVMLKAEATRRGVLVMGPDCGTAMIGGVPLGFANVVRRGHIGLVAASGTGLQEVTTQIDRLGATHAIGVSHAIGTGGRDVYAAVGGATMLQGIKLLAADPQTHVLAIVSKPPAPEVLEKVLAALVAAGRPAVVAFLGSSPQSASKHIHFADTLVDCAAMAVKLAKQQRKLRAVPGQRLAESKGVARQSDYPIPKLPRFASTQRYLRALFSGGTYAAEAQIIWSKTRGMKVWSNVAIDAAFDLPNPRQNSLEHTALDLGDDAFTVGRPHPMIDQAARIERLLLEAADPTVRVILLDVVIGWGAHADPARELAKAITQAKAIAKRGGRHLAVVGFVCGTEADPQVLSRQEAQLLAAGMVLAPNSASAAWLAGQWVS